MAHCPVLIHLSLADLFGLPDYVTDGPLMELFLQDGEPRSARQPDERLQHVDNECVRDPKRM